MIVVDNWKGLVTNASPYALPPGAAVTQINWQCVRPGELSARGGQAAVTFASITAGTTIPVVMARYGIGTSECVLYQDAGGKLRIARGIS